MKQSMEGGVDDRMEVTERGKKRKADTAAQTKTKRARRRKRAR